MPSSKLSSYEYAQYCVYQGLCQRSTGHSRPFFVPIWAHAPEEDLETVLQHSWHRRLSPADHDFPCFIQERDDGTFPPIVFIEIDGVQQLERLEQASGQSGEDVDMEPSRFLVVSTVIFSKNLFIHAMLSKDTNMKDVIRFPARQEHDASSSGAHQAISSSASSLSQESFTVDLAHLEYEKTFTVRIPVRETLVKKTHLQEVSNARNKGPNQEHQSLSDTAKQLLAMEKLIAQTVRSRVFFPILEYRGAIVPTLSGVGNDLQMHVLSFLTIKDLCTVACVCKQLRMSVNSEDIWSAKKNELEQYGLPRQGFSSGQNNSTGRQIPIKESWVQPRKECAMELNKKRRKDPTQVAWEEGLRGSEYHRQQRGPLEGFQPQFEPIYGPYPHQPGQGTGPLPHVEGPGGGLLVGGPRGAMPDDDLFLRGGQGRGRGRRGRGGGGGGMFGRGGGGGMFGFGGDEFI
eukprot:gb/GECG01011333.1/.p1 GENE.gb/GECG01011333.1/~~gb/GECG01011333.1/.p1  ORF type:complete len:459 (+),score=52.57 gb/GECG01011333.1/:1-1377(+)